MKFSTFQVCDLFDLSNHTLHDYVAKGAFIPSVSIAQGRGTRTTFSRKDVYRLCVFLRLRHYGIGLTDSSAVAEFLKERDAFEIIHNSFGQPGLKRGQYLIISINQSGREPEIEVNDILPSGLALDLGVAVVVDLHKIVRDVDSAIQREAE